VSQKNPVYSVLALIASFFGLSGLYVLLEAPFVAVVQIIIYAGAIMVLFLFTVMLLNVPREDAGRVGPLASALSPWRGPRRARCWRC
jgi:NADH-quinone oxidoreductase subunit J